MNRLLTHSLGPISFGLPLNKISFKWFCGIPTILNTHEEKWTWVWNLKLQKNIKHFLWFTYRDNIFYSYFLLEKSFKIKMWIHTLKDDPRVKSICHHLHILSFLNHFSKDDALWLHHNAMGSNSQLFGTTC